MKKILYLSLVSLGAIFFGGMVACTRVNETLPNEDELITLKFNITQSDAVATRALLGEADGKRFLKWENGDQIGTFSVGSFSSDATTSNNNHGTVNVSGNSFTLNIQTFNAGTVTNIYSYFPYSSTAGKDRTAAIVSIPSNQLMDADGFDADAMPMAGTPVSVDLTTVANTDTPCGTINFSNLGSIINFRIYSSVETDETLTSVKYVTSGDVGGSFSIDLTGINAANEETLVLTPSDPITEITTSYTTHPAIGTGKANAIDVYMVVAPGTYANTQIVVTTSAHTYTLNASGEKTFTRSHVKPMTVDIQNGEVGGLPAEETWSKVTSVEDFTAGTYYILRADGAYAVSNAQATSAPPACVSFTAGTDVPASIRWIATESGDGLVFESAAHEGYTLGVSNISGKANTTRVTNSYTGDNASNVWSFATINVDNNTYHTATAGGSKYLVSYGSSDWRYYGTSNISETNIPAEFYKLDVIDNTSWFSVESPLSVSAAESTHTVEVTRNNFNGAITITVPEDCEWLVADEAVAENANSFEILVSANDGTESRSVTLTLSGDGVESQTLDVEQEGLVPGTEALPYTVTEALAVISGLENGAQTPNEVYVSGTVRSIASYTNDTKSINYTINDPNSTANRLIVNEGKGLNGADFDNFYDLARDDKVVVKGYLFNNNGKKEIYRLSSLVAFDPAPRYNVTLVQGDHGTISFVYDVTSYAASASVWLKISTEVGYKCSLNIEDSSSNHYALASGYNYFIMPAADVTVTATYVEAGTQNNPYSVLDAINAINSLASNTQPDVESYVTGKISYISAFADGAITYYISDTGQRSAELYVYKGKGLDGAAFDAITDLAVGDAVVVKGYLYKYNNTTNEIKDNSKLISIVPVTRYSITDIGEYPEGCSVSVPSSAAAGAAVTLSASAALGYRLASWNVTIASSGESISVSNNKFTMPEGNVNVSALFEAIPGIELAFDLTSNPGGWPTTNSSTLTDYTYTLNGVAYTFKLKNVKQNSGYLMCTKVAALGLPSISGFKLTNVVAHNSSGCSTSVKVGVSSSASSESYVTGGTAQTWSKTNSDYTYTLSSTTQDIYYLYITSANAQITSLTLTYEPTN